MFRKVEPGTNIPQMEEGILESWMENNIFEKTLE